MDSELSGDQQDFFSDQYGDTFTEANDGDEEAVSTVANIVEYKSGNFSEAVTKQYVPDDESCGQLWTAPPQSL